MLRMYYAHVQMVLYRPFLHHALKDVRRSSRVSMKAYACGSACIKAAMQVVWLAERMEAHNLFNAAHWFVALIVAFTAACLVLFVTSNRGDPTVDDIADAVRRIKNLCARHAQYNTSMRRCLAFLEVLLSVRTSSHRLCPKADFVEQSLPPSIPLNDGRSAAVQPSVDPWHSFTVNIMTFSEASKASEDGTPQSGEEMLQAHNLPQLRAFLNCRM